ncbi:MAG: HDOD domain-containing protein [Gammaproteobacteria bacterium]|nr:HDOD domain-containing protein [Gammaproteobacteria bacterium]
MSLYTSEDKDLDFDKIIRTYKIPPQPHLIKELEKANKDLNKIADIISQDVALSAGILQTINSPFYGLATKITSIRQATVLLGLNQVTNIINCQLIKANMGKYLNKDLDDFWTSATDVAKTSSALVKTLGFGSPDEAYMLGLFHNCGIPIMMDKFADYGDIIQQAYTVGDKRITDVENMRYSTNHAVLGYMVARTWKLPEHLRIAIRDHHNFDRLSFNYKNNDTDTEADTGLAILKMAEHISKVHIVLGKDHVDNEWEQIKAGLFNYLGISEHDFFDISDSVIDKLNMY